MMKKLMWNVSMKLILCGDRGRIQRKFNNATDAMVFVINSVKGSIDCFN